MPSGLNGQPVLTGWGDPRLVQVLVPGTTTRLTVRRGWFQRVAAYVAWRWNREVEPLVRSQCYGFDYRPARAGGGAWSSHSTGYAIDLNSNGAGSQLWGDSRLKATQAQLQAMARIKRDTGLLWGGPRWAGGNYGPSDYAGGAWVNESRARFVDPMHWDLPPGLDDPEAWLKAMCGRLRIGSDGRPTTSVTPVPAPSPVPVPPPPSQPVPVVLVANVQPGAKNSQVLVVQKALAKEVGLDYSSGPSVFGPRTTAAYAEWQRRLGYTGADADGRPGRASLTELGKRHGFRVAAG